MTPFLPTLNACLNGACALCLLAGYVAVRRGKVAVHRAMMWGALACSGLFLISYLYYHFHHGSTRFPGAGLERSLYLALLTSHTLLAAALVFLVPATVWPALRGRFDRHRRLARWTWPIWMYVSVTGILVYFWLWVR